MPVHPPSQHLALSLYKRLLASFAEAPTWRLRPARPAHEGEAHELPPSARVFKSNAVVERVWRRLLNKAEAELQQLPELLLPLRRAKEAAKEAARAAARGRVVSADASALELALRPLVIAAIGGVARVFMRVANTTTVSGAPALEAAVLHRAPGQGLLTVSNHVGALDDPLVLAGALPAAALTPAALRYTLCATERCFLHPLADAFFRAGKVLPLARGGGLAQPGLAVAEAKLAAGEWIHIFPEGTRTATGQLGTVRIGVGRLYAAALQAAPAGAPPPLLLPFVHAGMETVNPRGQALLAVGQQVRVLVGAPLDLAPLLEAHAGDAPEVLYAAIARRVEAALRALQSQLQTPEPAVAASVAALPAALPPRMTLANRLCEWTTRSPASRELGRHVSPAGFAASAAWAAAV